MITADTEDWRRTSRQLKEIDDKHLKTAMRREIREAAVPIGQQVLQEAGSQMPKRGGLAERITGGKASLLMTLGSNVKIKLTTSQGDKLTGEEHGEIRHPVFGRPTKLRKEWAWVPQRVPAGLFYAAFEKRREDLAGQVQRATERALKEGLGK